VHPFAEEMNKARHVVARTARQLATVGWHVLQVDLLGCGDSEGDFSDATWEAWLHDLDEAVAWLDSACHAPLWIWGLRAGALLCADWSRTRSRHLPMLLWQPVLNGAQHLQQFLRIRTVAGIGNRARTETSASLRALIKREGSVEVAGYELSARLADGLESSALANMPDGSEARWFEVSNRPEPNLSPASSALIEDLRARGCRVRDQAVSGPAFWQSVELEDAPLLRRATIDALLMGGS
jgi:exosortase A-associated hydrolase 2